jgi:hypothetical protein
MPDDKLLVNAFKAYVSAIVPEPPPLPEEAGAAWDMLPAPAAEPAAPPAVKLKDQILADGIAVMVIVTVPSKSGAPVDLRLTIRRIYIKDNQLKLYGFGHELRRNLELRVDEILTLLDTATNVRHDNVQQYIIHDIVRSDDQVMNSILKTLRYDLTVLTFVARLSTVVTDRELSYIIDYVRTRYNKPFDAGLVTEYVRHLVPDQDAIMEALDYIIKRPPEYVQEFVSACVELVTIDDKLDEAERRFILALKDYCTREGVNFTL